ncbi:hypothetical protein LX32DRAFT_634492 [Colletotrichum zoysiae]|uniref:Secreted protein n=1 Tax=Colletotrichum zoysiae TaxID=1216348 RepID=A0AAD9HSI0_9PEZI|nr:hypothetical protein LX32DRAFT_634492 [Colletotrichum zoysiae]
MNGWLLVCCVSLTYSGCGLLCYILCEAENSRRPPKPSVSQNRIYPASCPSFPVPFQWMCRCFQHRAGLPGCLAPPKEHQGG